MRSDIVNSNSNSYVVDDGFSELGGTKKVLSFGGSTAEHLLDSATTAFTADDIIHDAGALDVTVPAGHNDPVKILIEKILVCTTTVTGRVELFGAGATQLSPEGYGLATTATEADDLDFNSATIGWAAPGIILPVATKYIYVCTTTAINHATNFNAGRYNVQIEYTVL